ncbi:N-acetylmuramoyl-L-alanine amidase [Paenisporosarcina cavernae]|uniref:N-acetylmuramoyl-L-alanine amidase n=1 Tax=Paenisporosarcina cavernae TaxID=2320858 RepID=A0A385YV64_9BACL|nr:N-acetylmuramoyl-L-alanine amidase [Paenisporosarcina cavernae]AYC30576.1 N-acetylmuramoyl-L-alanine amidase [Paenisporosarcina cavernae]
MKKYIAIGTLFVLCALFTIYETQASDRSFFLPDALGDQVIVLDPGHGGMDGGASHGEVIEKDINLALGKALQKELEDRGAKVVMTRTTEGDALSEKGNAEETRVRARKLADLRLRSEMVKEQKATLFVSVHVNAVPQSKWRGAQVFYHKEGDARSGDVAKSIQAAIRAEMENTDREALAIKQVYLLKKAEVPAVLVETGFISNDEERALLVQREYQEKMAEAIARGIENYVESKRF